MPGQSQGKGAGLGTHLNEGAQAGNYQMNTKLCFVETDKP